MGQYYEMINVDKNVKIEHNFDKIGGMKLMEHSYIGNNLDLYTRKNLADKWFGDVVMHVGDYANKDDGSAHKAYKKYKNILKNSEHMPSIPCKEYDLTITFKKKVFAYPIVANLDKKQYLDYSKCLPNEITIYLEDNGIALISCLCVSPLLLLTAVGNGLGGGDYGCECPKADLIGTWAGDHLGCYPNNDVVTSKGYKDITNNCIFTEDKEWNLNLETYPEDKERYLRELVKKAGVFKYNGEHYESTDKTLEDRKLIYRGPSEIEDLVLDAINDIKIKGGK